MAQHASNYLLNKELKRPAHADESKAFAVFRKNISRVNDLCYLYTELYEYRGWAEVDEGLLASAVVFSVGALDAFLNDLILEVVPAYRPRSAEFADAMKTIARDDPSLALRVALAPTQHEAHAEFRQALESWLNSKSFQGTKKIAAALAFLACPIPWRDFSDHLPEPLRPANKNLAERLDFWAQQRHNLVHRGARPSFEPAEVEDAVSLTYHVGRLIDRRVADLVSNHAGQAAPSP